MTNSNKIDCLARLKGWKKAANTIYDSTYNSPNEIKIQSTKFYKFLFLLTFLITVAFAKSFLY